MFGCCAEVARVEVFEEDAHAGDCGGDEGVVHFDFGVDDVGDEEPGGVLGYLVGVVLEGGDAEDGDDYCAGMGLDVAHTGAEGRLGKEMCFTYGMRKPKPTMTASLDFRGIWRPQTRNIGIMTMASSRSMLTVATPTQTLV